MGPCHSAGPKTVQIIVAKDSACSPEHHLGLSWCHTYFLRTSHIFERFTLLNVVQTTLFCDIQWLCVVECTNFLLPSTFNIPHSQNPYLNPKGIVPYFYHISLCSVKLSIFSSINLVSKLLILWFQLCQKRFSPAICNLRINGNIEIPPFVNSGKVTFYLFFSLHA